MSLIDFYNRLIQHGIATPNEVRHGVAEQSQKPVRDTNCPNCGAIITSTRCEYCGTMFGQPAYIIKAEACKNLSEKRRKDIEEQLKGPYGIIFTD